MADTTFGRKEHTIPVVENSTVRNALFPTPLPHQRVARLDTGMIDRWDPTLAQWLPEGVTRSAGPIIGSLGKGCKADGATNDGPTLDATGAFGLAIATGGTGELDVGIHYIGTNCAIPGHVRPHRGSWLRPANGVTAEISGTLEDVRYAFIDRSLGGKVLVSTSPINQVRTSWFKEVDVTVPAPIDSVISLIATQDATPFNNENRLTAGHNFEFCYTYVGHDGGETKKSPVTAYVGQTGFEGLLFEFFGALNCRALAVALYWRDVTLGGSFRKMAIGSISPGHTKTTQWGFGDMTDASQLYGVIAQNDFFEGAAYVDTNTAHDADGTLVVAPTVAPIVRAQQVLPANTKFYVAYSYSTYSNVTGLVHETALSPVVVGTGEHPNATTGASGGCLRFKFASSPPAGAVNVNIYVGTASNAMKKQFTVPLHHLWIQVNSYNAAGADNNSVTPLSTLSPLQQAWDCAHDSGGGRTVIVDSLQRTYVPLTFVMRTNDKNGMAVRGEGGPFAGSQQRQAVNYVGPDIPQVLFILSSSSATRFENLAFWDPNYRVSVGLGFNDPLGGNSFYNIWENVSVSAFQSPTGNPQYPGDPRGIGGRAIQASNHATGAFGHTVSEQRFNNCAFFADAWAMDIRGQQTANFRFHNLQTFSYPQKTNLTTMDSGDVKFMTDIMHIHEHFAGAHGGYVYFIGAEGLLNFGAGGAGVRLHLISAGTELDNGGPFYLYISDTDLVGSQITLIGSSGALNNLLRPAYDIYCGSGSQIVAINHALGNWIYLDHFMANLVTIGTSIAPATFKRVQKFAGPFPGFPAYYSPISIAGGGIGWISDTGTINETKKLYGKKLAADPTTNPANLANNATQLVTTVTVVGAKVGDAVPSVIHSNPLGTFFFGVVTADDTVSVYQSNFTGGAVDAAAGDITAEVTKKVQ